MNWKEMEYACATICILVFWFLYILIVILETGFLWCWVFSWCRQGAVQNDTLREFLNNVDYSVHSCYDCTLYFQVFFFPEYDKAILGTQTCSNTNSSSSYESACCHWWMTISVHYGSRMPSPHIKFTWNRDRHTCLYRLTFTSPQQKILFAKRISDILIWSHLNFYSRLGNFESLGFFQADPTYERILC